MRPKNYFESYNIIRFVLATLVVLMHCNQNLTQMGVNWCANAPILAQGNVAVEFFFILSGFLLTYLYLEERAENGKVNIYFFFLRRVLKIFPLYYLSVFIGYVLLGVLYPFYYGKSYFSFPIFQGLLLHLCFLPHFVIAKWTENVGALYSLWSIGVEEQFYAVFPFMMLFVTKTKRVMLILGIILSFYTLFYITVREQMLFGTSLVFVRFIYTLKFHFMLLGGVFAFLFYNKNKNLQILVQNTLFRLFIFVLMAYILFSEKAFDRYNLLQGAVFATLLLILAVQKPAIPRYLTPFYYFGKISFGIYIFHPYVAYLLRIGIEKIGFLHILITKYPTLYYIFALSITIGIAHISYRYYESYFLSLKNKYFRAAA